MTAQELRNDPISSEKKTSEALKRKTPTAINLRSPISNLVVTSLDDFEKEIAMNGIPVEIISKRAEFSTLVIKSNPVLLDKLSQLPSVLFIDTKQKAVAETIVSWHDLTINQFNTLGGTGGNGLMVSIKEKTLDTTDIDFKNRFTASILQDEEISQHANQMATIVAGAGNTSPRSKGVAWRSGVSSSSFDNILPDDDAVLNNLNVTVQNHSYGTTIENYYGAEARAYDLSVMANPNRAHVFSIGNAGLLNGTGTYNGIANYATTTGNFKMAKNVLVVGSHHQDFTVDARNSRGPAYDGRVLPHLVAFGEDGTSDGAASISGLSVIVQDEYKQKFSLLPDVAMVKSILVAAADDIGAEGIDFITGYGVVNGRKTIEIIQNSQVFNGEVSASSYVLFDLTVPSNTHQIRLALSWLDPAVAAASATALLHNLDLELISPDGNTTWRPWVLRSLPHIDSLQFPAVRKRDLLNNTELITLNIPTAGVYKIKIKSGMLTTPNQKFAVAYRIDKQDFFEWTFPYVDEAAEAGTGILLRWNSTYDGTANMEYTLGGNIWNTIAPSVNLSDGRLAFTLPNISGPIKFRANLGFTEYESDWLMVSRPLEIAVGFDCPQTVMLNWHPIPNATGYTVYALQDEQMQLVTTITDTVFFISKTNTHSKHFAVEPVFENGGAFRSLTYRYDLQGSRCYYKTFQAAVVDDQVKLTLELSTTYGVDAVSFQKQSGKFFTDVDNVPMTQSTIVSGVDMDLDVGVIPYRAQILLQDESIITTDTVRIYVASANVYSLFPNPVLRGEQLSILTDGRDLEVEFFDFGGKKQDAVKVFGTLFKPTINLNLSPGIYGYRVMRAGIPKKYGRLVVR